MPRNYGSKRDGGSFDDATKLAVWKKGVIVNGVDAAKKRKDKCDAWIEWDNYGKTTENGTGWEIDHIKPVAKDGSDRLDNLQPLQWENNRHKSDNWPNYDCLKSAR